MPRQPTHYALVIGIDDYPNFGSTGRPLEGAVADAEGFVEWLRDENIGGGLPAENCKLVVSSINPLAPKSEEIDTALEDIWDRAKASGGDRFYFYFSGHGLSVRTDNAALCLANWSAKRRSAALSSRSYHEFILQCTPFREAIILLDCCRVRQTNVVGRDTELACPVPVDKTGEKRSFVAYATEFGQAAFEGEDDKAENIHGYFTEALLSGLWGAAAQPQGGVTAAALKEHLEKEVVRLAGGKQKSQVPFDMPADTVFGAAKPQVNCELNFSARRSGKIKLEDGYFNLIREDDASTGPWSLSLRRGQYIVTEVRNGESTTIRVEPTGAISHVTF